MSAKIAGRCPDCGQEFASKGGLNAHVGTPRCRSFSREDEAPEIGVGETARWRRNWVMSSGQNFFVRR